MRLATSMRAPTLVTIWHTSSKFGSIRRSNPLWVTARNAANLTGILYLRSPCRV